MHAQVQAILGEVQSAGWLQPSATREVLERYQAGKLHWSRVWALVALGSVI
jgi:hypothetical protein